MAANWARRGCFLALLVGQLVGAGCGGGKNITRVTITIDAAALPAETLALVRTIRMHVEGDRQIIDNSFTISPGSLAQGRYEVTYHPLSKTGSLRIEISALDASGSLLARNSGLVTIKTGQNATVTITLTSGAAPTSVVMIDPDVGDLGSVAVGQTGSPMTFTVTNSGSAATSDVSVTMSGTNAGEMMIANDGCSGNPLGAGASCTMTVALRPTSAGQKTANLTVAGLLAASDGPGTETPLALGTGASGVATLTGTGLGSATLTILPGSQDLGTVLVGGGSSATFAVRNSGGLATGALSVTLGGPNAAEMSLAMDGCTANVLGPGASCSVTVNFSATSVGAKSAELKAHGNPGGDATANLTASVAMPGALTIMPPSIDFGGIPIGASSMPGAFTIRNTGGTPSGPLALTLGGSGSAEFMVGGTDGCTGQTLAAGAACMVSYLFRPTAAGNKTASLVVMATPGGVGAASLLGRGLSPALLSANASVDLGTIDVGLSSPAFVWTIRNVGDVPTGALGAVTNGAAGEFTIVNNCTGILGPGASCPISIALSPQSGGAKAVTITVTGAPGGAVALTATGTGRPAQPLSVMRGGNGTGTVTSDLAGINCGAACTANYRHGTVVTLTAKPDTGFEFGGWGGACTGTTSCVVTMTEARNVTAVFTLDSFALLVSVTGMGRVTSVPAGIDCGSDCGEAYPNGTMVQLAAVAATGYTFAAWGGACGTVAPPNPCTVTMSQARDVSATFRPNPVTLTVATRGNGGVMSSPTGINCSNLRAPDCMETYFYGDTILLTATPGTGSRVGTWTQSGGGCTGSGPTCAVTLTADTTVTVDFVLQRFDLTVRMAGAGAANAQVTSDVGAIACPGACADTYTYGTSVTLTAVPPARTSIFMGWDHPACIPTAGGPPPLMCTVQVTANTVVTARFEVPVNLGVNLFGPVGAASYGSVASTPAGIACPTGCIASFASNTTVRLVATPANTRIMFSTWAGPCLEAVLTGPTCTVALGTSAVTTSATFVVVP